MATPSSQIMTVRLRLSVCGSLGVVTGLLLAVTGYGRYAPLAAWDVAAGLYVLLVLGTVLRFSQTDTKAHALAENPGTATADALLLVASLASLFAIGLLILQSGSLSEATKIATVALGLVSVVISWATVHTLFMLRYARQYYGQPEGGIDFGDDQPAYADFAYLAFTIGMTFQVSDTASTSRPIRKMLLKHAMLSYVFGTVVIAATINLLAGLSK